MGAYFNAILREFFKIFPKRLLIPFLLSRTAQLPFYGRKYYIGTLKYKKREN
jgi:hypothetical protein